MSLVPIWHSFHIGDRLTNNVMLIACALWKVGAGAGYDAPTPLQAAGARSFEMANCEELQTCPFFTGQIISLSMITILMKARYCLDDKKRCAIYAVASAGLPVPPDLMPNDQDRAKQILESKSRATG